MVGNCESSDGSVTRNPRRYGVNAERYEWSHGSGYLVPSRGSKSKAQEQKRAEIYVL